MSTELIINATLPETRIALLENGEIQELHIERDSERGIVGNIYKGKVIRVLPGMQAAFVDIGLEKAAFLYVDDIYFPDMDTPLVGQPLVDVAVAPKVIATIESAAPAPAQVPAPAPVSVSTVVIPNVAPVKIERNVRGVRGGRIKGKELVRRPGVAPSPGSPEDHARLQAEYAKQMLQAIDDDEELPVEPVQAAPVQEEVSGEFVEQPAPSESDASENGPIAASPDPRSFDAEEQPEARAPQSGEALTDEQNESGLDADGNPLVYRPEPLIDAEAWVEDIAVEHAHSPDVKTEHEGAVRDHEGAVRDQNEGPASEPPVLADSITDDEFETDENLDSDIEAESNVAEVEADGTTESVAADGATAETGEAVAAAPVARPQIILKSRANAAAAVKAKSEPVTDVPHIIEEDDESDSDDDVAEMPKKKRRRESVNIADLVKEGQEILVQVAKDPIGTKGARLTCHVSLPGRYLVFMPTVDHIGVSRRIESEAERRRLKETISKIRPAKTGVIVRTASGKQTDKKLKADLDYLVTTWNDIQKKFKKQRTPSPVYQDLTIVLRAIRDMFTDEVDKVVVDSTREHKSIMKFVTRFIPSVKDKVELYTGEMPIFDAYGIETEISRALERKVWLKSGGYLVVDQAEALVAIDVNTGRYVGKKTLEETILKTNLEAVKEIAYQLRLRNCGGIIILDLIDMEKEANREKVYKALEEALKKDRARPSIMKISQLGLVEMTRKRTRDSLVRALCESCSYCEGRGFVKNKSTIAYDIMRDIEREIINPDSTAISIQCHPTVADVLTEDKRDVVEDLEHQFNKKITVRGNGAYHLEQYELMAHRESKNITWSSDERRAFVRQKIQERQQVLAAEQRKKADSERKRESEERRKLAETQRAERRAQAEGRRAQAEERRAHAEERRRLAAEQRAAARALRAEGAGDSQTIDPALLDSEEELQPQLGPDGLPLPHPEDTFSDIDSPELDIPEEDLQPQFDENGRVIRKVTPVVRREVGPVDKGPDGDRNRGGRRRRGRGGRNRNNNNRGGERTGPRAFAGGPRPHGAPQVGQPRLPRPIDGAPGSVSVSPISIEPVGDKIIIESGAGEPRVAGEPRAAGDPRSEGDVRRRRRGRRGGRRRRRPPGRVGPVVPGQNPAMAGGGDSAGDSSNSDGGGDSGGDFGGGPGGGDSEHDRG